MIGDFVAGRYPLPWSPIFDGLGDFVAAMFPLPNNPVGLVASSRGSLPKAPDLTQADIFADEDAGDCGGPGACDCADCSGMGDFDMSTIQNLIPGQTFGIPNTYLVAGGLLLLLAYSSSGSSRTVRGRRNPVRRRRKTNARRRRR